MRLPLTEDLQVYLFMIGLSARILGESEPSIAIILLQHHHESHHELKPHSFGGWVPLGTSAVQLTQVSCNSADEFTTAVGKLQALPFT